MENAALLSGKADDRNNRSLYREAVAFYYELLKESEELWAENLLTIQDIWKNSLFPEETEENQSTSRQAESSPFTFGDLP